MSVNRVFRLAEALDAGAIAALHADSWSRHYRGAYSDAFLDGDVAADRLAAWAGRLRRRDPGSCTILAEDDSGVIGFAHVIFDDDPAWGALLDNIHVAYAHQRQGVGSELLLLTSGAVAARDRRTGFHLWVLEQNVNAQSFYEAHGGRQVERAQATPPGGITGRLDGLPHKLRYTWADPSALVRQG
jgi:GNAT superfamily N-acetyltransferase